MMGNVDRFKLKLDNREGLFGFSLNYFLAKFLQTVDFYDDLGGDIKQVEKVYAYNNMHKSYVNNMCVEETTLSLAEQKELKEYQEVYSFWNSEIFLKGVLNRYNPRADKIVGLLQAKRSNKKSIFKRVGVRKNYTKKQNAKGLDSSYINNVKINFFEDNIKLAKSIPNNLLELKDSVRDYMGSSFLEHTVGTPCHEKQKYTLNFDYLDLNKSEYEDSQVRENLTNCSIKNRSISTYKLTKNREAIFQMINAQEPTHSYFEDDDKGWLTSSRSQDGKSKYLTEEDYTELISYLDTLNLFDPDSFNDIKKLQANFRIKRYLEMVIISLSDRMALTPSLLAMCLALINENYEASDLTDNVKATHAKLLKYSHDFVNQLIDEIILHLDLLEKYGVTVVDEPLTH